MEKERIPEQTTCQTQQDRYFVMILPIRERSCFFFREQKRHLKMHKLSFYQKDTKLALESNSCLLNLLMWFSIVWDFYPMTVMGPWFFLLSSVPLEGMGCKIMFTYFRLMPQALWWVAWHDSEGLEEQEEQLDGDRCGDQGAGDTRLRSPSPQVSGHIWCPG